MTRKNTDIDVYNRRLDLLEKLAEGWRYCELVEWYSIIGLSPSQLKQDRRMIIKNLKILTQPLPKRIVDFINNLAKQKIKENK